MLVFDDVQVTVLFVALEGDTVAFNLNVEPTLKAFHVVSSFMPVGATVAAVTFTEHTAVLLR